MKKTNRPRAFSPEVGDKFGKWTVIGGRIEPQSGKNARIYCRCDCGVEKEVILTNILNKKSTQCDGCSRSATKPPKKRHNQPPPIGTKINKWTVISEIILIPRFYAPGARGGISKSAPIGQNEIKYSKSGVKCECECGFQKVLQTRDLVLGRTKSCQTCAASSDMYISSAKSVWANKIYKREMPFEVFLELSQKPAFIVVALQVIYLIMVDQNILRRQK